MENGETANGRPIFTSWRMKDINILKLWTHLIYKVFNNTLAFVYLSLSWHLSSCVKTMYSRPKLRSWNVYCLRVKSTNNLMKIGSLSFDPAFFHLLIFENLVLYFSILDFLVFHFQRTYFFDCFLYAWYCSNSHIYEMSFDRWRHFITARLKTTAVTRGQYLDLSKVSRFCFNL